MLIVEGSDLVGKTTLCEELLRRLDAKKFPHIMSHFGRLPDGWDYYWSYLPRISRYIVQDRFHMSEIVYRNARQEPSLLMPEVYRLLDAAVRKVGALTVVVTASEDVLLGQIETREEEHSPEQIMRANANFLQIVSEPHWFGYTPDWDIHYHVDATSGFPSGDESLIDKILDAYCRRSRLLDGLFEGAPYDAVLQSLH
jgi:thymidylate kinase